jgi:hypothetical protein
MRNYVSDRPLTIQNPLAMIQAFGCVDKEEQAFNKSLSPQKAAKEN